MGSIILPITKKCSGRQQKMKESEKKLEGTLTATMAAAKWVEMKKCGLKTAQF